MRIRFTKMQGAGNDFVVLDETVARYGLSTAQYRRLADRHFGVGADQILSVRSASAPDVDFEYAIHNADGLEVEQCGNGARCFVRYVRDRGLSAKDRIRVRTMNSLIEPQLGADGEVSVDMGAPVFDLAEVPFDAAGLLSATEGAWQGWPLEIAPSGRPMRLLVAVLSMGNPHAVQQVDDVDAAPVLLHGPLVVHHPRFPQRANAGFMQIVDRSHIRLRVFERGAGETLSCGTGACAAVVAGIRCGLLEPQVQVQTRGGALRVDWAGGAAAVLLTGPATTVFEGQIDIPDNL